MGGCRKHAAREALSETCGMVLDGDCQEYFMEMQRDKDEQPAPASDQHPSLHPTNAHPLGKTATLPRVQQRPQLRNFRSIRVRPLSRRQSPNGSCRLALDLRQATRRGGRTPSPHAPRTTG
jgi:hypothetical protein